MSRLIDLTGKRFGRLTVIKRSEDRVDNSGRHRVVWLCRCDCGVEKEIDGDNLKQGKIVSCGCYGRERTVETNSTHHESDTALYGIWNSMKSRCYNPHNIYYYRYGGRGITVCDEWKHNYTAFRDWMYAAGYKDDNKEMTIDRIDNDGNYTPNNCRLATKKEQANNRRSCRWFTYNGETKDISQWSEATGINYKKLHQRLTYCGWDIEKALNTP